MAIFILTVILTENYLAIAIAILTAYITIH
jgi:hypothetical protein